MEAKSTFPPVRLTLNRSSYTRAQLEVGIFVDYVIEGTLPPGIYVISFAKKGESPSIERTIPFNSLSGSGGIGLSPMAPGWNVVPWSAWPPPENSAHWDIHLAKKSQDSLQSLAHVSLSISGLEPLPAPELTLVQYTVGNLAVQWDPQTYSDFVVTVKNKSGSLEINQPATGSGTTIEKELNPDDTYTVVVTAMVGGKPGPAGKVRTALVTPPVYTQLQYTLTGGSGSLNMAWGAVTGAEAYMTTVRATNGSYQNNIPSTGPNCQLQKDLDETLDYQSTTTAISPDGVIIGPPGEPLTAIVAEPGLSLLQYSLTDGGNLNVEWGDVRNATNYATTVKATDGSYDKDFPSTQSNVQIAESLDTSKTYQVIVVSTAADAVVIGPSSNPLSPLLISPSVTLLQYTLPQGNGSLETQWNAVPDATAYITTIQATDGSYKKNIPSTEPNSALNKTLDAVKSYQVIVSSFADDGVIIGPASEPLTAIVVEPSVSLLQYSLSDGDGSLNTNWGAVNNATGYITTVSATDGSYKKNIPSMEPNSKLDKTLPVGKTYDVTVTGIGEGGVVIGPPCAALNPIVEAAVLSLVDYDLTDGDGSTTVNWGVVSEAEFYVTTVQATDGSYKKNIPGIDPSSVLNKTLDASKTYTVAVSSVADGGIIIGPLSTTYQLILDSTSGLMLNYTGTQLVANWTIPASLSGKTFESGLYKNNAKIDAQSTTDNRQFFNFTLDAGDLYTTKVRAVDGIVKGPWTPFSQGPYAASLDYAYDALARIQSITWNQQTEVAYTISDTGNIDTIAVAPVPTTAKKK